MIHLRSQWLCYSPDNMRRRSGLLILEMDRPDRALVTRHRAICVMGTT